MIIALGDSVTFGFGIYGQNKWVKICGYENAGVNGDTTGGMLSRLYRDVISKKPDRVIVMGGANDFIMGASVEMVKTNMMGITQQCLNAGIPLTIASSIPCNLNHINPAYTRIADFNEVYNKLQAINEWYKVYCPVFGFNFVDCFTPFVGKPDDYWQSDGIHPSEKGHKLLAELLK